MLISELIKILEETQEEHGDLEVGRIDWYGELVEMDEFDFHVEEAIKLISQKLDGTTKRRKQKVLDVCPPDLGEEPD